MDHLESLFPRLGGSGYVVTSTSGLWSSKLGQLQDIQHRLEDLVGSVYGHCACFLRREISVAA